MSNKLPSHPKGIKGNGVIGPSKEIDFDNAVVGEDGDVDSIHNLRKKKDNTSDSDDSGGPL